MKKGGAAEKTLCAAMWKHVSPRSLRAKTSAPWPSITRTASPSPTAHAQCSAVLPCLRGIANTTIRCGTR